MAHLIDVSTFAAAGVALLVAHHVADYWIQTQHQANTKGLPGWPGRIACAAHVATYTATGLAAVLAIAWLGGLTLNPVWLAAGMALNAATHYYADRRRPLRRMADALHKDTGWLEHGGGLAHLDQAWHIGWIGVVAALIAVA